MPNTKLLFHYLSYLQYPIMLIAVLFALQPYFNEFENFLSSINNMLIFMGLGISFSTLQDTQKTQNEMSLKIWSNPKKGRRFLIFMGILTLAFLVTGVVSIFLAEDSKIAEVGFGILVVGIGLLGMLKSGSEMFEHHRIDKTSE
ncbi:MAG: hypothetical protein KJP00_05110 [Bacteroidia bacterium]|nr:hypothetical protein [Bacteroidia bacterium]